MKNITVSPNTVARKPITKQVGEWSRKQGKIEAIAKVFKHGKNGAIINFMIERDGFKLEGVKKFKNMLDAVLWIGEGTNNYINVLIIELDKAIAGGLITKPAPVKKITVAEFTPIQLLLF